MNKKNKRQSLKKRAPYSEKIENYIIDTYNMLSEKDKRLYSAVEALKLPWGGQSYVAEILNCSRTTILRGIKELKDYEILEKDRIRKHGGGRKSAIEQIKNIDEVFLKVIDDHIAGDPMNESIRWTNLSQKQISARMKKEGVEISVTVVKQLLKKHKFVKRKALKKKAIGSSNNRNEQFEKIKRLKEEYQVSGNPVVSVDTKKKNL